MTKTDQRLTSVDHPIDPEVIVFRQQFDERSPLDQLVREGARKMLQQSIDGEVEALMVQYQDRQTRTVAGWW